MRWSISFRKADRREARAYARAFGGWECKVRELTEADIARFGPIQEVDPGMPEAVPGFHRRGRPPIDSPKVRIGFRLAPNVVGGIRATGRGYNARVERVLLDALMEGKL